MADGRAIGVFDSGVGGLTVLREILRRSPHESLVYLGDNARAPYGVRSDDEVRHFSTECLDRLVAEDVKALVVACNTSTAVALGDYRRRYDLPVLGVIRPGAQAAALATRTRRVGVIATPATIRSHAYFDAIKEENPAIEVYEHATPALVPLVEDGHLSGPMAEASVGEALAPLLGRRGADGEFIHPLPPSARIDTILLGCTHYPLLRSVIQAAVGDAVAVVDFGRGHRWRARRAPVRERPRGARYHARHGCRPRACRPRGSRGSSSAADPPSAHHRRPGRLPGARDPPVR